MKRRRRQPTKPRAQRVVEGGDAPTKEWRRHFDAVVEERDIKGLRGVRNLAQTAFDRYHRRCELAPGDRSLNAAMYAAGEQLRADWERSGLDLMARPSLERSPRGAEQFTAGRIDALARVRAAMIKMGAARSAVVDCAVYGEPVGRTRMELLRAGLKVLVK